MISILEILRKQSTMRESVGSMNHKKLNKVGNRSTMKKYARVMLIIIKSAIVKM